MSAPTPSARDLVHFFLETTKSPRDLMHDELSRQVERSYGPPAKRRSRRRR